MLAVCPVGPPMIAARVSLNLTVAAEPTLKPVPPQVRTVKLLLSPTSSLELLVTNFGSKALAGVVAPGVNPAVAKATTPVSGSAPGAICACAAANMPKLPPTSAVEATSARRSAERADAG